MKLAWNHESAVVLVFDLQELQQLVKSLSLLESAQDPIVFVGDGNKAIKVRSLEGLLATVRLEDFEIVSPEAQK